VQRPSRRDGPGVPWRVINPSARAPSSWRICVWMIWFCCGAGGIFPDSILEGEVFVFRLYRSNVMAVTLAASARAVRGARNFFCAQHPPGRETFRAYPSENAGATVAALSPLKAPHLHAVAVLYDFQRASLHDRFSTSTTHSSSVCSRKKLAPADANAGEFWQSLHFPRWSPFEKCAGFNLRRSMASSRVKSLPAMLRDSKLGLLVMAGRSWCPTPAARPPIRSTGRALHFGAPRLAVHGRQFHRAIAGRAVLGDRSLPGSLRPPRFLRGFRRAPLGSTARKINRAFSVGRGLWNRYPRRPYKRPNSLSVRKQFLLEVMRGYPREVRTWSAPCSAEVSNSDPARHTGFFQSSGKFKRSFGVANPLVDLFGRFHFCSIPRKSRKSSRRILFDRTRSAESCTSRSERLLDEFVRHSL